MTDGNNIRRRGLLASAGAAITSLSGCLGRLERFGGLNNADSQVRATDVFVASEGDYKRYRIPALVTTANGTLLAFCEARDGGDRGPTEVVIKRSFDNGKSWTDQKVVYSEGNLTIGNPTPVIDRDTGTIFLSLIREYRDILITKSTDDGKTWTPPTEITRSVKQKNWGYYATGPGVGIQLEREPYAGRLIVPATHWTYLWEGQIPSDNTRYNHAIYSDDGGETWQLGGTVSKHVDEPQAVELVDGRVLFNMRNYWGNTQGPETVQDVRATATSSDGTDSWSGIDFDHSLVSPTCQASILRYSWPEAGRNRILFSNPADKERRIDLTVRISYDDTRSWEYSKLLNGGTSAYSCLAVLADGSVGCLFERGPAIGNPYAKLTFSRFTLEWLTDGVDSVDRAT